jgi:hypothetical protein
LEATQQPGRAKQTIACTHWRRNRPTLVLLDSF